MEGSNHRIWTVAEAKARLSEILRRAETEGPQRIGTRKRFVVVPEEEWQRATSAGERMPLGRWLLKNMPQGEPPLELPSRDDGDRPIPFADEAER